MEWIILGIVVIVLLAVVLIYNRLVSLRATCRQGWADIDAGLRQRHDLIPNLVSTVQGYAAHEKSALEAVIAAITGAVLAVGGLLVAKSVFLDRVLDEAYRANLVERITTSDILVLARGLVVVGAVASLPSSSAQTSGEG